MHTKFAGTQSVAVSIDKTWVYLADIGKVSACVPGLQDIKELEPEHWQAHIAVGIGLLKLRFALDVTRPQMWPQERMTVIVRGKAPGSAFEVIGHIRLEALATEQTLLHWDADITITGAIAAAGGRIIQTTGERLVADYFSCLKERLQASVASGA